MTLRKRSRNLQRWMRWTFISQILCVTFKQGVIWISDKLQTMDPMLSTEGNKGWVVPRVPTIHDHLMTILIQAVFMRIRKPQSTATIRSSGHITVTGSTSDEDAKKACRRMARCLQKLGFNVRMRRFRITNVLGNVTLPFGIKLAPFTENHPKICRFVFTWWSLSRTCSHHQFLV
jgi:hypothetical protein